MFDNEFRRSRLDLAEAERRLNKIRDDHKDVVPREEHIRLQEKHIELSQFAEQLKQNFRNVKVEYK
jgi:hypothetical protein